MTANVIYYARFPLNGGQPYALFRYYADNKCLPEKYVPGKGWIGDDRLLLYLMMGELGPPDVVSEDELLKIIEILNASNAPV